MMPQGIPMIFYGCSKKLSIKYALACPNGGLVMAWHDDTSEEWVTFGSRALTSSAIFYEPQINSRTV